MAATVAPAPGAQTLPAAARDIRVGSGTPLGDGSGAEAKQVQFRRAEELPQVGLTLSHRTEPGGGEGAEALLPGSLTWRQPGSAGESGVPEGRTAQAAMAGEDPRPAAAPFQPEPLTYASGPQADTRPKTPPPQSGGAVDLQNLPDWAKRFLREGAPTGPGGRTMGVARDIASLPPPETGDSVHWTAPGYQPPEAPMAYRERERTPQRREPGQIHISDAEIQRTADQVYRLIEERLRRERRRLGF